MSRVEANFLHIVYIHHKDQSMAFCHGNVQVSDFSDRYLSLTQTNLSGREVNASNNNIRLSSGSSLGVVTGEVRQIYCFCSIRY